VTCLETRVLSREALAALCTAQGKNPSAGGGRHPRAETMATLANKSAGLVSALHGATSDYGISSETEPAI
jgi:hypothetical protein